MSVEQFRSKRSPQENLRFWSKAVVISAGVTAAGVYGWDKVGDKVADENCTQLVGQANHLERKLYEEGILGSGPIFFFPPFVFEGTAEIRNPDDSRLRELGKLKNERDKQCSTAQKAYEESFGPLPRGAAIIGGLITLLGVQKIFQSRKELKEQITR